MKKLLTLILLLTTVPATLYCEKTPQDQLKEYVAQAQAAEEQQNAPVAAEAYANAIKICRAEKDRQQLPLLLLSYGQMEGYAAEYTKAIEALKEAYEITNNDKTQQLVFARTTMQLGITYFMLGDFDHALEYYTQSADVAQKIGSKEGLSIARNNIANIYQKKHNYKQAVRLYEECLSFQKEVRDSATICNTEYNIGTCYEELNQNDKAYKHYQYALQIAQSISDSEIAPLSLVHMATIDSKRGLFDQAEIKTKKAISISRHSGYRQVTLEALNAQSQLYARNAKYDDAYKVLLRYNALADSLQKEKSAQQINEFTVKYKTREKELQIESQEQIITQQHKVQILLLIAVILFAVMLGLIAYILHIQRRRNRELQQMNTVKNKFFSIISHDLKNPVIAQKRVLEMMVNNFDKLPPDVIHSECEKLFSASGSLLDLLYNLLSWSRMEIGRMKTDPSRFDIADAFNDVKALLEPQSSVKQITITSDIQQGTYAFADLRMIATVARNIISNSIKFTNQQGNITISVKDLGEKWEITVKDNGVGMSKQTLDSLFNLSKQQSATGTAGEQGSGLGLIICREMVEINGGSMTIISDEGQGTAVSFTLNKVL